MTKAGKMMANMLVWDGENYREIVVFPQQFSQNAMRIKPWVTMLVKPELMKDGTMTVARQNGMIDAPTFLALKRMEKETKKG